MRTETATLAVTAALVFAAPAGLHAQEPVPGDGDGFWHWALAEVRRDADDHPATSPALATDDGETRASSWQVVPFGSLELEASGQRRRADGRVGASDLRRLIGPRALERLLEAAGFAPSSSRYLNGRWQLEAGPAGGHILQIRVVDRPLAEINDVDGDGRVDAVLVHRSQAGSGG